MINDNEKERSKLISSISNDLILSKKYISNNPINYNSDNKPDKKPMKTETNFDGICFKELEFDSIISRTKKILMKNNSKANFERSIVTKTSNEIENTRIPYTTLNKNHSLLKYSHVVPSIKQKFVNCETRNSSSNYRNLVEEKQSIKTNKELAHTIVTSGNYQLVYEKFKTEKKEYNFDYSKIHKINKKEGKRSNHDYLKDIYNK